MPQQRNMEPMNWRLLIVNHLYLSYLFFLNLRVDVQYVPNEEEYPLYNYDVIIISILPLLQGNSKTKSKTFKLTHALSRWSISFFFLYDCYYYQH